MSGEPGLGPPILRVMPFRIAVGVMGAMAVVLTAAYTIVSTMGDDRAIHRFHFAAGSLSSLILGAALFVLAWRPRENVAALQLVVVGAIASLTAGSLGGDVVTGLYFIPAIGAVVAVMLYPWNADVWRLGRPRPVLFTIAIATAVPLIAYALTQDRFQLQALPGDPHVDLDHYSGVALAALAMPVTLGVAAIGAPGWRFVGWVAATAFAAFGVLALAFAGSVSAPAAPWGWASIAAGVLAVIATEMLARRSPRRS